MGWCYKRANFRSKNCVLIGCLYSYFNENQYPDEAKREEIANACNAVIQKPGKATSCALRCRSWLQGPRLGHKAPGSSHSVLSSAILLWSVTPRPGQTRLRGDVNVLLQSDVHVGMFPGSVPD